jgi:hypothetical protein
VERWGTWMEAQETVGAERWPDSGVQSPRLAAFASGGGRRGGEDARFVGGQRGWMDRATRKGMGARRVS